MASVFLPCPINRSVEFEKPHPSIWTGPVPFFYPPFDARAASDLRRFASDLNRPVVVEGGDSQPSWPSPVSNEREQVLDLLLRRLDLLAKFSDHHGSETFVGDPRPNLSGLISDQPLDQTLRSAGGERALEAARATPYVLTISPEKRSGKTRVLEVAELVVREPVRAANITAAGVFQAIEKWTPTLLVDEIDAVFRSKSEQAEALRGVLNAGNRRGSHVIRGSQDGEPVRFGTFCPKMLAGINTGKLPDTIRDRSIVLSMERRRAGEKVDDLFPAELADQLDELRRRLEDWAAENIERLRTVAAARAGRRARRPPPGGVGPALFAIADLARGRMAGEIPAGRDSAREGRRGRRRRGARARADRGAAIDLRRGRARDRVQDDLPEAERRRGAPVRRLLRGRGDQAAVDLAKLLRPYGIKPKKVRVGIETPRGYEREQFDEVWQRYAPDEHARGGDPSGEAQQAQQAQHPNADADLDVADVADVALAQEVLPYARVSSNGNGSVPPLKVDPRMQPLDGETFEEWEARVEAMFERGEL